jgi:hypothetical protein
MDEGTGLAVLGSLVGSKELIVKLLGPTASYLGDGLKYWTEHGCKNLARIFRNGLKHDAARAEGDGVVHPRTLKAILDHGAFCEDELAAEYFGGVLASSRTGVKRDDRGTYFVNLVGRLTVYQLRAHCFIYQAIKSIRAGETYMIDTKSRTTYLATFLDADDIRAAMAYEQGEIESVLNAHVFFGLAAEGLVEDSVQYGMPEDIRKLHAFVNGPGAVVTPTPLGAELYLWAHGRGDMSPKDFLDPRLELPSEIRFQVSEKSCKALAMPPR